MSNSGASALVINSPAEMIAVRQRLQGTVGFVPTMGALHAGHLELLKKAKAENDSCILSIFVNPTQFNNPEDFSKYPKSMARDIDLATQAGLDIVFVPNQAEIYPDNYQYKVSESQFSKELCGAFRPGHFDGVLTVVQKLLNIIKPDKAYFGEKDFQQLSLIQGMAEAFFMPVKIIAVSTVRDADGLALSSRNQRLTPEQREKASLIYKLLSTEADLDKAKQVLTSAGFKVEYLKEHKGRRFVAAWLGDVRLIDNLLWEPQS